MYATDILRNPKTNWF